MRSGTHVGGGEGRGHTMAAARLQLVCDCYRVEVCDKEICTRQYRVFPLFTQQQQATTAVGGPRTRTLISAA